MARRYSTDAELTAIYSAFASAAEHLRLYMLDLASTMIALEVWGEKASFGHLELTGHFLAQHPDVAVAGASPQVVSRSIGGLSISYSVPSSMPTEAELSATSWGKRFIELRKGVLVTPIAAAPVGGIGSWGDPSW